MAEIESSLRKTIRNLLIRPIQRPGTYHYLLWENYTTMKRKLLLSMIAALFCLPNLVRAEFTPIAGWDTQLFPSFLIATAALKSDGAPSIPNELGDTHGLLGIEIVAPHANANIEVTIECEQFAEPSRFVGVLENEGETYTIQPKIKYKYDRLSQCLQATPANVTFRVVIDQTEVEEKSVTVTFRSINDCPLGVVLGENVLDTSFTVASFVNEQHPFIDKLLREALDIGVVASFDGYQSGSEEAVLAQVYSIWDLLVQRDVRYSSITRTAADSPMIFSQNIRLIEDTVNNQQANCIDGAILMVSILRKIDIDAKLVLVPGHCYMGFYLDKENTKFVALETTLVGSEAPEPEGVDELLEKAVDESLRDDYSWASFVAAINVGMGSFDGSREKFDSETEQDYKLVDISVARSIGILPIPHRNTEVFVSFDHSESAEWDEMETADDDDESEEDDEESEEDDDSEEE
jgi:hypothetical protein